MYNVQESCPRQHGDMEKQTWAASEKRNSQKKKQQQQQREKVEKSSSSVFVQCFVAQEDGKKWARWSGGCGAIWSAERSNIARRCGAKHVLKSKRTKHTIFGPFCKVEMLKN